MALIGRKNPLYVYACYFAVLILLLGGILTYARPAEASPAGLAVTVHDITSVANGDVWYGDGQHIYYIKNSISIGTGVTLNIQAGAIVKFKVPTSGTLSLYVAPGGTLNLNGVAGNPVYFSSYRDDNAGGVYDNTNYNKDLDLNSAKVGDWGAIILEGRATGVSNVKVTYSKTGLQIWNKGTAALAPPITSNIFMFNECGLTLSADSSGGFSSVVDDNTFEENEYGLCTDDVNDNESALFNPTLTRNRFLRNHKLPILLEGTSFPVYGTGATDENVFVGYDPITAQNNERHLGIGLRGSIFKSDTWPLVKGLNKTVNLPYVIVGPLEIKANYTVKVLPFTIFKFYTKTELGAAATLPSLTATGTLDLPTAPVGYNPAVDPRLAIFTSYQDDTAGGDTNGDGNDTLPLANDWGWVHIIDNRPTAGDPFRYEYMDFRYGANGLWYEATVGPVRAPTFAHLNFYGNINGLRIGVDDDIKNTGRIEPAITDCTFQNNGRLTEVKGEYEYGVPIYLHNTVIPTYLDNTFIQPHNMAIGVAGTWNTSTTWGPVHVKGVGPVQFPYLVYNEGGQVLVGVANASGIDDTMTLTIPAGAVIKFNVNKRDLKYKSAITAYGALDMQGTAAKPIVFTSLFDNVYGGDISGDSAPNLPSNVDWDKIEVRHPSSKMSYLLLRYSQYGLYIHNVSTYLFDAAITNSIFEKSTYGVILRLESSGNITSLIQGCTFRDNVYGLVTDAKDPSTGISKPFLKGNTFTRNTGYPIYLGGSASPIYDTVLPNSFSYNTHRAIGMSGYFGAVEDIYLPRVYGDTNTEKGANFIFPYVVADNATFDWQTKTHLSGGLVFKFNSNKWIKFAGVLDMTTSSDTANRNIFTAYTDDTVYDDTDAAPPPAKINRNYWDGIYIANTQTRSFSYSTLMYANNGLEIIQVTDVDNPTPGDLAPDITSNTFQYNVKSLYLNIGSIYDIKANVTSNVFQDSDYGLYTEVLAPSNSPYLGSANPILKKNQFNNHSQFPIYLKGSSDPQYGQALEINTFAGNVHPGIGLEGYWTREATWTLVKGDGGKFFPYVLMNDMKVIINPLNQTLALIHIPANSLIKVDDGHSIHVYGRLDFQGTPGNEVTITSYRDDVIYHDMGGDTNADGIITLTDLDRGKWKYIVFYELSNNYHHVNDVVVKYSEGGLVFEYSWDNGDVFPTVDRAVFDRNVSGITLMVGWRKEGGVYVGAKGSIRAALTDINFQNSAYGLLTVVHNNATGVARPTLTNVTFHNIYVYPMFFGGTTQADFASGNLISADPQALAAAGTDGMPAAAQAAASAGGITLDLYQPPAPVDGNVPQEQAAARAAPAPGAALASVVPEELAPAIALGGPWNNAVALPSFPNIPYAVVGSFPIYSINIDGLAYKVSDDITIGEVKPPTIDFATVTVPAGGMFKFNLGRKMIIKPFGDLTMLSTWDDPVLFTSFLDDSAGGDTNRDGALTQPAPGNWVGIYSTSQNKSSRIHDAFVRFATEGLHVTSDFDFSAIEPNKITVDKVWFFENTTALVLEALRLGNLYADVNNNLFFANGTHILAKPNTGYSGLITVSAHSNDFLGNKNQTAVVNLNTNTKPATDAACEFDATNNYWGDASGPYNDPLNTDGLGSTVSTLVRFDPFGSAPFFPPATYTLYGRITDKVTDAPLSAVQLTLEPLGLIAYSQGDGTYTLPNVPAGKYTLVPSKEGYSFDPPQIYLDVISDASGLNFKSRFGTPVDNRMVSVNSATLLFSTQRDITFYIPVTLSVANTTTADIKVTYTIINGTAVGGLTNATGVDFTYTKVSNTFTFAKRSTTTVQYIPIVIKKGTPLSQGRFFTVQLSLPATGAGSVQIDNGVAVFDLAQATDLFLPYARR